VTTWLVRSAILSGGAYAILLTTDVFQVRRIAFLIWPTVLFLLANESATTSVEVATNFAKAIGGNVALYVAVGVVVFEVRAAVRKFARRPTHEV